tara:strand:- start:1062 stop:1508 length:447 start_codon:yes stop_codon:yes gene_type:complete
MQISKNFNLSEFTYSPTALRLGIFNEPTNIEIDNIVILVQAILQPLRDIAGPIRINSGYRSKELNSAIGGAKYSQHCKGMAADISIINRDLTNKFLFDTIYDEMEYDQIINEFDYSWIHVSYNIDGNRCEALSAIKEAGKTKYIFYDK